MITPFSSEPSEFDRMYYVRCNNSFSVSHDSTKCCSDGSSYWNRKISRHIHKKILSILEL